MTALRYLIALPDAGTMEPGATAIKRVDRPGDVLGFGPSLWISDPGAVLTWDPAGPCLIGTLFGRGNGLRVTSSALQGDVMPTGTPMTMAEHLIKNFWGGYLALFPAGSDHFLLRSPLGQLPCYRTAVPGYQIFASDPRLLLEAGLFEPAVNWAALDAHLRWPGLRTPDTCLVGLSEIPPGALIRVVDQSEPCPRLWSPWYFTSRHEGRCEPQASASNLRAIICQSVAAWTRDEPHVVVTASGGVDSSIICAALAANGTPFTCLTLATADPSGDERSYVRLLARHLGVPIIERIWDPNYIDLSASASRHLARPSRKTFMQQTEIATRAAAHIAGARLILDGNGGDHLFCFLHSSLPVVDRLRAEGLTKGSWQSLLDMCDITQCDALTMARMVLKHGLGRMPPPAWRRDDRFLRADHHPDGQPIALTPYLAEGLDEFPGKRAHVELLMRTQNNADGYAPLGNASALSPLLSQPVVEYCLSVPTWQWCKGGINRSLARDAFRADLPRAILDRVAKAGPDSFIIQLLTDNRAMLREQLLEGELAQHGLVDRAALEAAFTDPATSSNGGVYRIFDLVEAQAWIRSWMG